MPRRSSTGRGRRTRPRAKTALGRLRRGIARLVGDLDMGHRVDELADEVVLRALHQRRHRDREADAERDAEPATIVCRARPRIWASASASARSSLTMPIA
jgi:hypothetical protein